MLSEMTDSENRERAGKRERLVASAGDLFHRQGMQATTLAEVAQAADVPVGNVYYYFKTKEELVAAVIEGRAEQVRAALASFEPRRDPRARLKAFVRSWAEMGELVARHGCPLGSFCSELDKGEGEINRQAAQLMALCVDWAEEQFRLLGTREARDLAVALVGAVQGSALLSNTFRDPALMTRQSRRLAHWIDSLP